MPNPLLAPLPLENGSKITDPAADLAAYLARSEGRGARDERPRDSAHPSPLVPSPSSPGRRAMAKRGCYACHDIAGFETAAPIGPT